MIAASSMLKVFPGRSRVRFCFVTFIPAKGLAGISSCSTPQPTPKLGDWVEVLTEIIEKEAKLPKRERRSTQRLFEELRGRGYDGAHDSVHRFVKAWRDERARVPDHACVPMSFAPGEAYQFDWSHATVP